jgi:hypothetical protein
VAQAALVLLRAVVRQEVVHAGPTVSGVDGDGRPGSGRLAAALVMLTAVAAVVSQGGDPHLVK